ncbi:MAG TPA: carboxypeptidase-like regulatory domain-containing protein [Holophaga sp.]|nr:carboxypeptidase-like regulatory domain-containing protein [Holophaga sp.]
MITGYNTDVRHGSRVFHVQTEDKGLANPKIETLIYVGGEILDSYRGTYEDLAAEHPVPEPAIQARMDEQHKAVIRDIKNGKYDTTPGDVALAERSVFNEKPLDQAILEYLQAEGDTDVLELVLDEPMAPKFGEGFQVRIRARLCVSQAPVAGAEVTVRLISSLKKASTLAVGRTDAEGAYSGSVELPPSQPGHAALQVSCASEFGSDEVRALITA